MPFDGNGTFTKPSTSVTPATSGTTIESSDFNTWTTDVVNGLTNCVCKDGQTTSPILTNPKIISKILDTNANELVEFGTTSFAVNHIKATNSATLNAPKIEAAGDDPNISLELAGKGTGDINVTSGGINVTAGDVNLTAGSIELNRTSVFRSLNFTGPGGDIYIYGKSTSINYDVGLYDDKNSRDVWLYDEDENAFSVNSELRGSITEHSSSPASLTGASVTLGSIPSHVKRIVGVITGASASSGLINLVVTIGDSGGIETTGYRSIRTTKDSSVDNYTQSTTGFFIGGGATAFLSDIADSTFELVKGSGNTWHLDAKTYSQDATPSSYAISTSIGSKTLSSTLTQIKIENDGNNFDAGTVTLYYYG